MGGVGKGNPRVPRTRSGQAGTTGCWGLSAFLAGDKTEPWDRREEAWVWASGSPSEQHGTRLRGPSIPTSPAAQSPTLPVKQLQQVR